ncbi:hypothetical protein EIP91_001900 [Steccherinum ochraceum]|uniref:Prolyl 4-hydroxylase alpha subunit Fe(2+) 2OG dioxygenase domain-containing protein n=1 Tax=Steccherinum ochraceum TaxID=92696 RepID=A0A4R0RTW7_9APHY|nr:hypothetical protein EIP91_001900 [Steccherinum ochraceum]
MTASIMCTKQQVKALRAAINTKTPYLNGMLTTTPEDLKLFYMKGTDVRCLDFTSATDDDLEALSQACDPATFGLNQEDVLDETYRKAGKLDTSNFATTFDPYSSGLLQTVNEHLLSTDADHSTIRAERYKINVYDAFFKAHKDTPRSEDMFGSLVLVFPTKHEGGALILRDDGEEWMIDTAKAVNETTSPCIGYVAFYSDVEHEVSLVKSGYRVTLTYNFYRSSSCTVSRPLPSSTARMQTVLKTLLDDPTFLPEGGYMGFGLQREYVLPQIHWHWSDDKMSLRRYYNLLKGGDAELLSVARQLSLNAKLYIWYDCNHHRYRRRHEEDDPHSGVLATFIPADHTEELFDADSMADHLVEMGGLRAGEIDNANQVADVKILWVTKRNDHADHRSSFARFGNQAQVGYEYGSLCMVVRVAGFKSGLYTIKSALTRRPLGCSDINKLRPTPIYHLPSDCAPATIFEVIWSEEFQTAQIRADGAVTAVAGGCLWAIPGGNRPAEEWMFVRVHEANFGENAYIIKRRDQNVWMLDPSQDSNQIFVRDMTVCADSEDGFLCSRGEVFIISPAGAR